MELNFHSFKKIKANNKLVKGRLKISAIQMQSLFRSQQKLNNKIQNELDKEQQHIQSSINRIKGLKSELRHCEETMQKAFYPSNKNISLLYKKVGKNQYVKARFYWNGQQREVQVGSLQIIFKMIHKMSNFDYFEELSIPKSNEMTWDRFVKNDDLIMATKEIAALKFQEYVLRKILNENCDLTKKPEIEEVEKSKHVIQKDVKNIKIKYVENEKYEWYEKWRRNNL